MLPAPDFLGGNSMLHRLILAVALLGFLGAVTLPSYTNAQTTTEEKKDTKKKTTKAKKDESSDAKEAKKKTAKKKLTPAQQKFSDCAKSWGDHKKATGEKTRKQYNAYMKGCLKKET
jgi:hypothetical protein